MLILCSTIREATCSSLRDTLFASKLKLRFWSVRRSICPALLLFLLVDWMPITMHAIWSLKDKISKVLPSSLSLFRIHTRLWTIASCTLNCSESLKAKQPQACRRNCLPKIGGAGPNPLQSCRETRQHACSPSPKPFSHRSDSDDNLAALPSSSSLLYAIWNPFPGRSCIVLGIL
jgi:hypothetical protein